MIFTLSSPSRSGGNAMIYILIALALLGALTMTISSQNDEDSNDLTREEAEFLTTKLTSYTTTVDNVTDQMVMSGSDIADISFLFPNNPSFDAGDHSLQLFHPDGGGVNAQPVETSLFPGTATNPPAGWYIGKPGNIQWTPTAAADIVMTAHQISQSVCQSLNKKITGSINIPVLAGTGKPADYLIEVSADNPGPNADLDDTVCNACDGYPALCVTNTGATEYTYYTIIEGL